MKRSKLKKGLCVLCAVALVLSAGIVFARGGGGGGGGGGFGMGSRGGSSGGGDSSSFFGSRHQSGDQDRDRYQGSPEDGARSLEKNKSKQAGEAEGDQVRNKYHNQSRHEHAYSGEGSQHKNMEKESFSHGRP